VSDYNQPKAIRVTEENLPVIKELAGEQWHIDPKTGKPCILPFHEPLLDDHYVIIYDGIVHGVVSPEMFHSVRAIANAEVIL
jgi:hypothetical protein